MNLKLPISFWKLLTGICKVLSGAATIFTKICSMKIKIYTVLFSILITQFSLAQSIQLEHEGEILQNGEEVVFIGNHELPDMAIDLIVTNISGAEKNIGCFRYEIDTITASALYMCWANCTVIPFGGTVLLQPNESTELFSAHINPNENYGIERNLYSFYDENNPNDSISFIATFVTTSFHLLNENGEEMLNEEIENWGVNGGMINYELPSVFNQNDESVILLVEQEIISQTEGSDVSFYWDGVEYYDQSISDPALISSGNNEGVFAVDFSVGDNIGLSKVKYTFFEQGNLENSHELILIFNATSVGIEESNPLQFSIYPNPSNGAFIVNSKESIEGILIYDYSGRLINNIQWNSHQKEQLIELPSGQYMIQLLSDTKISDTKKILVF